MFQMIQKAAAANPDMPAYEFYNRKTSYKQFVERIETAARAFTAAGVRRGDAVTICMPNTPQALDCFYALNRIGAVANMIHPLSDQKEITFYLNFSGSKMILTTDLFYEKVEKALESTERPVTIPDCPDTG